jgi:[ribosomal protein S18]-alanine N-acetyltransferase
MMAPDDTAAVMEVERLAFSPGWAPTAFAHELTHNGMARYVVLESASGEILGFAGLWLMVDEAHVVTVAVPPPLRGRGYGRLLVHALVELARDCGMASATLEVRDSNAAARNLYGLYGFYEVGLRKRYYADNGEDAVIMTTEEFESPAYQSRLERLAASLAERLPGVDPRVPFEN